MIIKLTNVSSLCHMHSEKRPVQCCMSVFNRPFLFTGATSAPCLIFIFPAVFYIRIVPNEDEPMNSVPKITVRQLNLYSLIDNLAIISCETGFCRGMESLIIERLCH